MRVNLYSVFDIKAQAFMQPFFQASHGLASRLFSDAVNDPKSFIAKHPADFSLRFLGTFDDGAGLLEAANPPQHICNAVDFLDVSPGAALDVSRLLPMNGARVSSPAEV